MKTDELPFQTATKKQRQVIAMTGRRVLGGEDHYRAFLSDNYGVDSPTLMSKSEAADCIDVLRALEQGKPVKPRSRRGIWLTKWQRDKIVSLLDLLGWIDERQAYGFIKKQTGRNKSIDMLTRGEATKVIVGLQRVYSRGDRELYKVLNEADADSIRAWYHQNQR